MAERIFYRLLDTPFIYNLAQVLLAPGATVLLRKHFQRLFGESKGLVLDVGCGPKLTSPVPEGKLIGLDPTREYVRAYTKNSVFWGVTASGTHLPFYDNAFEETRCCGVFHHLDSLTMSTVINEMVRCTKPGGRVIIMDSVWPHKGFLRPLAWLNLKMDRGKWMLREGELEALVHKAYSGPWHKERFTYSFVGHEALTLSLVKTQ